LIDIKSPTNPPFHYALEQTSPTSYIIFVIGPAEVLTRRWLKENYKNYKISYLGWKADSNIGLSEDDWKNIFNRYDDLYDICYLIEFENEKDSLHFKLIWG